MDRSSSASANGAKVATHTTDGEESAHQRDRRREKAQLSCNFCRRRKVRCDRQLPCKTCVSKGIAFSCAYAPSPQRKGTTTVGERIQQLESMVRSLLQQQQQIPQTPGGEGTPGGSPQSVSVGRGGFMPPASAAENTEQMTSSLADIQGLATSPAPSDAGSLRMHSSGTNYVNNVHWAAVLDSISELKDHYEKEEEARMRASSNSIPRYRSGPRLLYEPVLATKVEILADIPPRPVVDRAVARYFNARGIAPVILHSGQFLRQYEEFWQNPSASSFIWIGLLFSILCLSTQYQQFVEESANPDTTIQLYTYRERTTHCLVLGQYTRGGAYVLETLINCCASEVVLCNDADIGLWLLLGILVQIALSLGYHRDPSNFPSMSTFEGEMRRRVWASIMQMDLRLSSQMGLPRLLKSHTSDTGAPLNLLDSDFDETTIELPPSRPETEVTPVLYILAKNRIDSISGVISDLVADTREHPYSEIMQLDQRLQGAGASLPPIFQWHPLSQSFMVPPDVILFRIWLQIAIQRLLIWLHRKYLAPLPSPPKSAFSQHEGREQDQVRYQYSRNACVQAATKIIEFQRLIDEERQPNGQLYPVRWMFSSSLLQSIFLLGMSILCYYVQLTRTNPDVKLDPETDAKIHDLLRSTYPLWLRSSAVSRDAQEGAEHLRLLLGLRDNDHKEGEEATMQAHFPAIQGGGVGSAITLDQVTWDAYQECITNFPTAFNADFMGLETPESTPSLGISVTDPLPANATIRMNEWLTGTGDPPREG